MSKRVRRPRGGGALIGRPAVADPEAKAKLEAAAEAAGCSSIEELVTLVLESGEAAVPPEAGVLTDYTLRDLGERLWIDCSSVGRSDRADWYSKLTAQQQHALVTHLVDMGYRPMVIGRELGVAPNEVLRIHAEFADRLGEQVVGMRLQTLVGQQTLLRDRAIELELQAGRGSAAMAIHERHVKLLQSLGVIEQVAARAHVSVGLDDATRAHLDRLVQVQAMKERAAERIKLADATVFDAVPEIEADIEED